MPLPELLSSRKGEMAALATAVCWSLTPFFFTAASRRVGAFAANVTRLVFASILLAAAALATSSFAPVPARQGVFLALSGIVGLTLGDAALFDAFVILGPSRVSLLGATAPVFVAIFAVPLLGEGMSVVGIAGMALTLGGVAWVIAESGSENHVHGSVARGVTMGVLAAVGQGLGGMLVKAGLGRAEPHSVLGSLAAGPEGAASVEPLLGTLVRMLAGCGGMLVWTAVSRRFGEVARTGSDRRAVALLAGGAVFGPFVGVWLSLTAYKFTREAAVAQTIMAISPVLVILIARIVHGERASARAVLGSVVAVGGVAVLGFRDAIESALAR